MIFVLISGVGNGIKWTNLNPQSLMKSIKAMGDTNFPFDMLETYMKRVSKSGISIEIIIFIAQNIVYITLII